MTCKNKLQNPKERRKYGEPLEWEPQRDEASRGITTEQLVEKGHKHWEELAKINHTPRQDQVDTVASGED